MDYYEEITGITQSQAIENLRAVLSSDNFRMYDCKSARISSDLLIADLRKGFDLQDVLKVADISDSFGSLLETASKKGTILKANIVLKLSDEMLNDMQFEDRLYDETIDLPMFLGFRREERTEEDTYNFSVSNLGLRQSYFESQGLDFQSAQAKVNQWYKDVTISLDKVLPHKVSKLTFSE